MKISEAVFESLLDRAYKHLLSGRLRISISLEVDRLPEETKAMYLQAGTSKTLTADPGTLLQLTL